MVGTRFSPCKSKCGNVEVPNNCPCLSGTFLARDLTFSGIFEANAVEVLGMETVNRTYDLNSEWGNLGCGFYRLIEILLSRIDTLGGVLTKSQLIIPHILFTRARTVPSTRFRSLSFGDEVILPVGVKAVAILESHYDEVFVRALDIASTSATSIAIWHKVLDTDPNASVDCTDTITGFVLNKELTQGISPTMDVSESTVIYN